MEIRAISWEQTIPLRQRVLWPSKSLKYCYVDGDIEGLHYGAFVRGVLVCVASVYFTVNKAQLRKFATDNHYQHQGIGSKMLAYIIQSLKDRQVEFLWCDAREAAVDFYKRFGLQISSDRFYKADVPFFKMEVAL
ncbi:MAG: GNAT family N-acetyltransferase [Colwellia sp.]|jgi:ribosomal protein S18 acetylase RimI-like enzyme|uniref:GNAT family N-acetyltransferase n=1 Tax=Colwellia sp. Bg11-12 TaxID=2759817 RepID=UPI0015F6E3CA|nr:GNAT family N-acetyltransferase [Colwellia sp. Bg11-12]MBA6264603.1 GNAT family N-acetyltransferase [Colwellia sp. Bg11-12]